MENDKKYPKFNEQKATEASVLLLKLNGGSMDKMKLIKLLYFADRKAFEKWERPITNDIYYSMTEGQVLSGVLDLINNIIKCSIWQKHIERVNKITIRLCDNEPLIPQKLSRAEVKLLENIYINYGHLSGTALGKLTKAFKEYKPTKTRERTYTEEVLGAIFEEKDVKRIQQQLEEKAYLELALER